MSELDDWHTRNAAYLGAALTWLRLKLAFAAHQARPEPPMAPSSVVPPAKPRNGLFNRASSAPPAASLPLLPAPTQDSVDQERINRAATELEELAKGTPPPALILLADRLGLSLFERNVLLLCIAMELDTRVAALCADVHGERERAFPTFALAMTMFEQPAWEALSPERPLRRLRLLEVESSRSQPLTASALRADERIVSFIKGLNFVDERLAQLLVAMEPAELEELAPSQRQLARSVIAQALVHGTPAMIRLTGNSPVARRQLASAVCRELRIDILRLHGDMLPNHPADIETLARLWHREYLLAPVALYVELRQGDKAPEPEGTGPRLARFLQRTHGLVFLDVGDSQLPTLENTTTFELEKPTPEEQANTWRALLGADQQETAALLVGQFNLNLSEVRDLAARGAAAGSLWQSCLAHTRAGFDGLAQKLEAKATWQQIVLPANELSLLRHLATQVRSRSRVYDDWGFRARMNRGLGISALFAGESGTGKTMAAEVLANELQLDLYRIDLSAVVSKYIGETEKNLRKVFDAAEQGGALLFFDEADALFGKRSEVKDSHDRYANIEVNYLLQRLESFAGLAILATNLKSALDPAFVRRLRFIVNFSYPAVSEREEIWRRAFPESLPREQLDYGRLSKFNLTGGNIHSIALNAAFLAADAAQVVSMPLLLEATRMELRKLERPVNESELRWEERREAYA